MLAATMVPCAAVTTAACWTAAAAAVATICCMPKPALERDWRS